MRGVLLIGHGSPQPGAGAAMIRLTARLRTAGVAPIAGAGFLNHSHPTFAEALARCVAKGASEIVIQPYFLTSSPLVCEELPRLVEAGKATHPAVSLLLAAPLGDHPVLAKLVLKRAAEAEYTALHPQSTRPGQLAPRAARELAPRDERTGLLLIAHGGRGPEARHSIVSLAARIRATRRYAQVAIGFMETSSPSIGAAIERIVAGGIARITAVPYFLQSGVHVNRDIPAQIDTARARHAGVQIVLAEHLAYDRLLVAPIADRVAEALARMHAAR